MKTQHPLDPSITLIISPWSTLPSFTIPASASGVGVDIDSTGLVAYRKDDTAYGIANWLTWWQRLDLPLEAFEMLARIYP